MTDKLRIIQAFFNILVAASNTLIAIEEYLAGIIWCPIQFQLTQKRNDCDVLSGFIVSKQTHTHTFAFLQA